jgi:hypothetical protein
MKDELGRKFLFIIWAGGGNPIGKIKAMEPERLGIEIATGGNILAAMKAYKALPGMEGATYYYHEIPKNPVNDWLVSEHQKRFKSPPDFFTAGGMTAAIAAVEAHPQGRLHGHGRADRGHGRHGIRNAQGHDDLPPRRSPGTAVDVPLQDPGRSGRRMGHSRTRSRAEDRGHVDPGAQRALRPAPRRRRPRRLPVPFRTQDAGHAAVRRPLSEMPP